MKSVFLVVYVVVALLVIAFILLQGRGAGLGSAWGGGGETFTTRRGVEKLTFSLTISLVVLFLVLSIVYLFL
jgi:preprotein translocase subunit SecG